MQKTLALKKYVIKDSSKTSLHSAKELSLFPMKQSRPESSTAVDSPAKGQRPNVPSLVSKMQHIGIVNKSMKEEPNNNRKIPSSIIPKDVQSLSEYK